MEPKNDAVKASIPVLIWYIFITRLFIKFVISIKHQYLDIQCHRSINQPILNIFHQAYNPNFPI